MKFFPDQAYQEKINEKDKRVDDKITNTKLDKKYLGRCISKFEKY